MQIWPTFKSPPIWNSLLTLFYEFLLVICLGFSSESEYFFAIFYPKVFKLLSQSYLWRILSIQGRVIWIGYWLTDFWEYQGISKSNNLTVSLNVLNWDAAVIAVANSQAGQAVSLKTCQVVRCTYDDAAWNGLRRCSDSGSQQSGWSGGKPEDLSGRPMPIGWCCIKWTEMIQR